MDAKDILQRLDVPAEIIEKAESGELSQDDFNAAFEAKWISKEKAKSDPELVETIGKAYVGKRLNIIDQNVQKGFKELGMDISTLTKSDDGIVMLEDYIPKAFEKAKAEIESIRDHGKKDADEKYQELMQKNTQLSTDLDTYKSKFDESVQSAKQMEQGYKDQIKGIKISDRLTQAKASIKYKDDISPLERAGFDSVLSGYQYELDDSDNVVVRDKEGQEIWNDKNTQTLSLLEVVQKVADEHNLVKKNNAGGTPPRTVDAGGDDGNKPLRKIPGYVNIPK